MNSRFRVVPLLLIGILLAAAVSAEPLGRYWTITPFGGFTMFDSALKFPGTNQLKDNVYLGGRAGYQAFKWGGIEAAAGFTPTSEDITSGATDVDWTHLTGDLVATPWSGKFGGPFIFAGAGWGQLKPGSGGSGAKVNQGLADYGAGLNFWLSDALGLRIEARQLLWMAKESGGSNRAFTVLGGGVTFAIGGEPRDTDGDGVPDKIDKCPDTPKGARADAEGCPHDADKDGVLDGLDQCPQTPAGATVNQFGCPSDTDKDGIFDGIDKCPNTPAGAKVDATGCPIDTDGDGVYDGLDQCPDTPIGCKVDMVGCPADSDSDGVCDGKDKCPGTPAGAKVDADGCPIVVLEKETELLDTGMIRLHDVNFATGKAVLTPDSYPSLDEVGQVLSKWPELKIEVGGHTDSQGSEATNQKLSENRAQAVLNYMKGKFPDLKGEQFTVKGYGESKPIAPNTTQLGRAKNRRVEFVVLNKDVLKRESEKRGYQQK